MKQRLANRRLIHIQDVFVPLALLAGCFLNAPVYALILFAGAFAVSALSLFAAFGERVAFAHQPAMRDVRGSVKCALLLESAGYIAATALVLLLFRREGETFLPVVAAGFFLNIEHTFYEYLLAAGEKKRATACEALAAVLALGGLALWDRVSDFPWILAATGVSALAAAALGAMTFDGLKGEVNAKVLRCAPRAAIQCALYPVAAALVTYFLLPKASIAAGFAGLAFCAIWRTPFRRSRLEAPPMNRALVLVGGVALAALLAVLFVPGLPDFILPVKEEIIACCAMMLTAAAVSFGVYGNISRI